jgi:5-methylcytosine-specific restriction endonuclease McrA
MPSGNNQRVGALKRRRLWRRQQGKCHYCGVQMLQVNGIAETHTGGHHEREATIDHIIPLAGGGGWSYENLVYACYKCNHEKGNQTPGQAGLNPDKPGALIRRPI